MPPSTRRSERLAEDSAIAALADLVMELVPPATALAEVLLSASRLVISASSGSSTATAARRLRNSPKECALAASPGSVGAVISVIVLININISKGLCGF
jgi:hypothetical protein